MSVPSPKEPGGRVATGDFPELAPPSSSGRPEPPRAEEIKAWVRQGRLYEAVGVDTVASVEEIRTALEQRWNDWAQARDGGAKGAARRALDEALEVLKFLGAALLDPNGRRACHLAFHNTVVASSGQFPTSETEQLRMAWVRLFPDAAAAATQLSRGALQAHGAGKLEEARASAREALDLDPFNLSLRSLVESWLNAPPG